MPSLEVPPDNPPVIGAGGIGSPTTNEHLLPLTFKNFPLSILIEASRVLPPPSSYSIKESFLCIIVPPGLPLLKNSTSYTCPLTQFFVIF